ncbi:helix-turn-helix domain-containing protein [Paenisporosarcina sp. OV554]|uniref:helix-turn-helix domain-containing protein n=1 Tax=Paenisporosarcina sp. OV554 TaxID=2135694 RepID=UPI000D3B6404|nr:XRE family transcriptional regulator [Paenisporosarcina sp. OV554]PUB09583.1 XRE family transcriptional regulator [Paenisporosarcina sp. OV554]
MSQGLVGITLKSLRKERKLTLKDLAAETGVSISFLSQVERGKSSVTLESLKKIADALSVNPSVFFAKDDVQDDLSIRQERFFYKDLSHGVQDASFSPILVTLQPGENEGNAFSHGGHEFLFVVEGLLTVEIDGKPVQLNEQQSILFDARKTHYWYNHTEHIVRFLVVSSKN